MSSSNPTPFESERQYRPTYNSLPKSRSSVNFGAPFLPPIQPTIPKSESSANIGAAFHPPMKAAMRRRHNIISDLHSAPTVATSSLTASASQTFMHPPNRLLTPTKIPSPIRAPQAAAKRRQPSYSIADSDNSDSDNHIKQASTAKAKTPARNQYVVDGERFTQILPASHKKNGENTPKVNHQMTPRYQAPTPAPPSQPEPSLPRARTLQALTSLTNSFSLNSLRKASSHLSLRGQTVSTVRSTSGPAAFFSRSSHPSTPTKSNKESAVNLRDVKTGMPQSYWAGRYRTLDDKFRSKNFEIDYLESPAILEALREIEKLGESFQDDNMSNADQLRCRRVFAVLETHCKTADAKKSLWSFQQAYARNLKCQQLLPVGGTIQEKENILSRAAGKLFNRNRSVSVLGDKKFMKHETKAEERMYRKKVMEKSLLAQERVFNQYEEAMEALISGEL
ncbi:hypothetical protein V497_05684 [Pseudogymnoascus sp. VKM F-4516 (FW-969)]|nr:hypothetical protein V497_05684 [Pseudogymnoascus sp. VKM F-4516 (FW-969)]